MRAWLTDTNGHLKWDRGWHVHYVLYSIYSSTCYQNGEDAEHHGISKGGLGPLGGKTWRLKLKEKMHEVFIVYSSCFPAILCFHEDSNSSKDLTVYNSFHLNNYYHLPARAGAWTEVGGKLRRIYPHQKGVLLIFPWTNSGYAGMVVGTTMECQLISTEDSNMSQLVPCHSWPSWLKSICHTFLFICSPLVRAGAEPGAWLPRKELTLLVPWLSNSPFENIIPLPTIYIHLQ